MTNGAEKVELGSFYDKALTEAEQQQLPAAREMEGLDEEIAVLRTKFRSAVEAAQDNTKEELMLMMRGIDMLVKAVSARYRLSPKAEEDLADSLSNVIRGVGGQLMPERFNDG